ncbi:cytochrome P450 [Actinomadura kijaniata]|uniref:cytochrome P450 n=1 Tax=Actinomadura kijaniata TaxID=46161 RepID=UPI003F1C2E9F
MSTISGVQTPAEPEHPALRPVPLRAIWKDVRRGGPLELLDRLAREEPGRITQLRLGPFRPLLVTHPDHLRHVLRDRADNYPRGAAMWSALGRLTGDGIGGEGPRWHASRQILQSAFSGAHLRQMSGAMLDGITAGTDELVERAATGPVDAGTEMTRLVQRVIDPVFFGDLIPDGEGDRLGESIATAMGSLLWRMALPFVPHAVPLPGDLAFWRATRTVRGILQPLLAEARRRAAPEHSVITKLMRGTGPDGRPLTDQQIVDDIVALFVAGSESSAIALTWVWVALAEHPHVLERVREEVDRVIGDGGLRRDHVRELAYTKMVLREVLRIYSVGWAVPRMAAADDVLGDVPVRAGTTLVISPYLTHRLPEFWPDPLRFDPLRFTRERARARDPLAYLPFGDGVHQCLGEAFFLEEATLVVAELVRRCDIAVADPVRPKLSLTVQPRRPVRLRVAPRA